MAFGRFAHLDMHQPVTLTKQEVENNLPSEDKGEFEAAQFQDVSLDKPILLFHKPANDNNKPGEPETTPDQAETALQEFYLKLSPQLKKVVSANDNSSKQKHTRPNRTALKTTHAPKPTHAATKSVASEPLKEIVHSYQDLNEPGALPLPQPAANHPEQHRGSLKLLHIVEAAIKELPKLKQEKHLSVHDIILVARLLKLAA